MVNIKTSNGEINLDKILLKDFDTVQNFDNLKYIFGIDDEENNHGVKISSSDFATYIGGQGGYATVAELDELAEVVDSKQDQLVSHENIKTINGVSMLGSGNIAIGGNLEVCDIGISLFVDESKGLRRYLNGSIVDINSNTQGFLNRLEQIVALHPSLSTTEENWQAEKTMSVYGQCGKFVINKQAGTIRLPRIVMPIQGLTDLSKLGELVEQSLPNIRGQIAENIMRNQDYSKSGVFDDTIFIGGYWDSNSGSSYQGDRYSLNFNANNSSSIYKDNANVQQEQIQYPYFIQIASGQETQIDIVNEIEFNNPYSLLDVKWTDHLLENVSWLRSSGQANNSNIHPTVYNLLLSEYNQGTDETETISNIQITYRRTPKGFKITKDKIAYDSILNATGTAWFYVLDIENQIFYLPQTDGFMQFGSIPSEYKEAGLPNITGKFVSGGWTSDSATGAFYNDGSKGAATGSDSRTRVSFDASRSSDVYGKSNTVQPNSVTGYLYFYVGETVQNANLIDAGRITENFTTKSMVDGQWVNKVAELPKILTGSYDIDLSDYLPNDNYNYEVMFAVNCSRDGSNNAYIHFKSSIIADIVILTTSSNAFDQSCAVTFPIGSNKILSVEITGNSLGSFSKLEANGYRRIGTNV